jgi:hypothetical protein
MIDATDLYEAAHGDFIDATLDEPDYETRHRAWHEARLDAEPEWPTLAQCEDEQAATVNLWIH